MKILLGVSFSIILSAQANGRLTLAESQRSAKLLRLSIWNWIYCDQVYTISLEMNDYSINT